TSSAIHSILPHLYPYRRTIRFQRTTVWFLCLAANLYTVTSPIRYTPLYISPYPKQKRGGMKYIHRARMCFRRLAGYCTHSCVCRQHLWVYLNGQTRNCRTAHSTKKPKAITHHHPTPRAFDCAFSERCSLRSVRSCFCAVMELSVMLLAPTAAFSSM